MKNTRSQDFVIDGKCATVFSPSCIMIQAAMYYAVPTKYEDDYECSKELAYCVCAIPRESSNPVVLTDAFSYENAYEIWFNLVADIAAETGDNSPFGKLYNPSDYIPEGAKPCVEMNGYGCIGPYKPAE